MAAQYIPIKRISSLDTPIKAEKLDGSLFTTENQAHEFIISVRKNGVKQTVTGSVSGKFIRANGTTIFLQGSIVDGDAVVRLHQDCYNVQGRFTFNIFNTQSGVTTCIYSAVGKIDMGSTETVIDAGDVVPDVSDVVAKQEEMTQVITDARTATTAANTAATNVGSIVAHPYSAPYNAWDYCTQNGNLYRANLDIPMDEEWTASHWTQIVMGDEVARVKDTIDSKVHYIATDLTERVYPVWEIGGINNETGEESTENAVRTKDYIPKESISLWIIGARTGALYVHRYNYADGVYTHLGYNQRTGNGNYTNWLKNLSGTHFRFENLQTDVNYPNTWMTLCYKTTLTAMQNAVNAVQNFNIGTLGKDARTLIIDILRSAIFTADVADKITMLNRYLIQSGELIILQTGKRYYQTGYTRDDEYSCITDFYPIEDGATSVVIYMAIDDLTQLGVPYVLQRKEDDTLNGYLNMSNSGRQNAEYRWSIADLSKFVGFTLNTASVQKSYAYFLPSGNLVFAGAESAYAGLKNIGQKGADT